MFSASMFRRAPSGLAPLSRSFTTTRAQNSARMNIIGRLGAEPELVSTSTGRDLVRYVIGTDSGPKDNKKTSWFRVACFDEGPRKDYVLGLPKGSLVHVEADARIDVYDDPNVEGKRASSLNLVQRSIDVLGRPRNEGEAAAMSG
ncbi:ssDNA binding protein [Pseudovirgaria hyperparasitica]|uniref:SsDNA binding protein n=1 Tax=Pseudovirgaria hyperparasitica TaxID=470096 RepID=A0A6A6W1Y7_9PEZI|nr:ssDNA binding protein [Pseudovirgaria hyperparasitica]KAF2755960.1 ssDNA binding protein [Pseudovirgaria hyperparasitica]